MTETFLTDDTDGVQLSENERAAVYSRVSTADQGLNRQARETLPYARDRLGADLDGADVEDVAVHLGNVGGGDPFDVGDVTVFHDKSTGTDTNRDGYTELMERVKAGEFAAVVVHDTTRLSRSLQDIERTVERVTENGAALHFVRDNLPPFTPDQESPMGRLMLQMLGAFAEWEARTKRMNTKEGIAARRQADDEYHHGRPPLGFEKKDGKLYEQADYDRTVAVLDMVLKDELSKRKAADMLDTTRKTISRAIERKELYGL